MISKLKLLEHLYSNYLENEKFIALLEEKLEEALSDYNLKEAARVSTIDTTREFNSFSKLPSKTYIKYQLNPILDSKSQAKNGKIRNY